MTLLTLLNAPMLAAYTAAGFWGEETIYRLAARHARTTPDAFAVRDRHRRLTYAELVATADRLAANLADQGLRPGQRVAVWLPSRVETAIALVACSRNGYVCCPSLHRDHRVGEVVALVDRMRAAALIGAPGYGADADRHDIFAEVTDRDFPRCALRIGPAEAPPFADLPEAAIDIEPSRDANQIMYLPFTSGTTGEPKGVLHSDNTLLATARMMARDWKLECAVLYTLSPLSHNLGLGALITALAGGGELVLHDLPRGASLLDRLEQTRAEFLFGVPTHAIDLLAEARARGVSRIGTVRGFRISGAAAPPHLVTELLRYGVVPQSGYGMTETCSHQYTLPDDPPERIAETCGRACAGYEVRIWRQDDPDAEAAPGEIGEIGGRGASLMLGYFDDQRATEAAFNAEGWFMTGDLGWLDEAGYLHVTGRKKELIIRGGRNIHPAKIEALALRHEAIEKAAAFPVADERLGERVCLAVVTRGSKQIDAVTILEHLDACGLSRSDMPEFMLPLTDMPLTASGKLLKRELVRRVADGELQPHQCASVRIRQPASPMRAVLVDHFGAPEALRICEVTEPTPGPGEVLVTVHAAPVNYVDLLMIGGSYQFLPPLPFIPGKGPAGVVTALGPEVTTLRVGDRVLAMAEQGGYAELVAVRTDQCYRLPAAMSFSEAASLSLVYDTAWFALRERARLEPRETVLVLGASGGVGLAAVRLARAMGARVLAGISRSERAAAVRAAGADSVIDLSAADLRDSLRAQVYAATEGRGADIILDPLGGAIFEAAVRALAWRGRLVVIGFAAGAIPSIKTNYLLLKNIEISGLQISDYRKRRPDQVAACFAEIFSLYEQGEIKPAPVTVFPLERAGEALAALRDRRIAGRAVLQLKR